MGTMTVITVLNDAAHVIASDASWGSRLVEQIRSFHRKDRHYIAARGEHSVFVNAAEIISMDHADYPQFVVAWHNSGWTITSDPNDGIPDHVIKDLERVLKDRRKRVKRAVPQQSAPGHTDLMVAPESITDEWLAANPLPPVPPQTEGGE